MTEQVKNIPEKFSGSSDKNTALLPDIHDRITEAYYGKLGDKFARSTQDRIHWVCSNVKGQRVLDVGCSQGIAALILGREGKTVVGIDVAKRSIEEAREYLAQETAQVQEQVRFVQGDFLTANLETDGFETVIIGEVLEHLTNPEVFISAAAIRLKKNGRVIVTVPFGVNDFHDHKKTFYLSEPWRIISKHFYINEIKFFGKWIGFVATLRCKKDSQKSFSLREDDIAQSEVVFQKIERRLLERVKTLTKKVTEKQTELLASNKQNAALKKSMAESETARVSLGQSLTDLQERAQSTETTLEVYRAEMQETEARLSADTSAKDKEISRLVAELSASERWAKHHEIEAQKKSVDLEAERSSHVESETRRLLTEHKIEGMASRLVDYETQLKNAKQNFLEQTQKLALLQSQHEQLRAKQDDKEKELTSLSEEIDAAKARELTLTEETEALRGLIRKERQARETQEKKKIQADERADRQRKTLSFRLGNTLIFGFKSWRGILNLPSKLWSLKCDWASQNNFSTLNLENLNFVHNTSDATHYKKNHLNKNISLALALPEFLKELNDLKKRGATAEALSITKQRLNIKNEKQIAKAGYWLALQSMDKEFAMECLERLSGLEDLAIKSWLKGKRGKLEATFEKSLDLSELISERSSNTKNFTPIKNRICYCLHNSLPYSSGGYATRGHGIAQGLQVNGLDVICLTRPGYPKDLSNYNGPNPVEFNEIDGIKYFHISEPNRRNFKADDYLKRAVIAYEKQFFKHRPSVVMAASNHINAIPAMIAAKKLGISFYYEVRGFWEITRISREPKFEQTKSFAKLVEYEKFAAQNADHVFTLTNPMREELERRGVSPNKITLVPNSCDPSRFIPRLRDRDLAQKYDIKEGTPVIGYIGTFAQYEGLNDLVKACALLKKRGHNFKLLLVGGENASGNDQGLITEEIIQISNDSNLLGDIIMPGRIPHEQVEAHYSLIDIAPFPRKPQPVTEMVSPMKPLEALAMQKAVVASSVRALSEMIEDGKTGLLFKKGDVEDLTSSLEKLICNPGMRNRLGKEGRKWIEKERHWNLVTASISDVVLER